MIGNKSKYLLAQKWIRKIDRKLQKDLGFENRRYWQAKRRLWLQRASYWERFELGEK
jgi:hypothetical protein